MTLLRPVARLLRRVIRATRNALNPAAGGGVRRAFNRTLRALVLCLPALFTLGCTVAQGRAVAGPALAIGEAICETFVPMALPGYGAIDVLGCKALEGLIAGAVAAGTPTPAAVVSASGGGAGFDPRPLVRHPLRVRGQVVALMPASVDSAKAHAFVAAHPELWGAR